MKKISFTSVSIALLITLFYTFVFCMVGNVDDIDTYAEAIQADGTEYLGPADADSPDDLQANEIKAEIHEKYLETSWWKANLEAYTSTSLLSETSPATTAISTTAKTSLSTTIATTTTPVTTTVTTTAVPVTTTPAATTTVPTTTAATTITGSAVTDEKLSYVVNGIKYRGNAYDIVCQVVTAEMGGDFNEEALKAQAIATYSYLKYNNQKGLSPTVSVRTSIPAKVSEAVKAVYGLTAYYNGAVAQTVYSSATGGFSASAINVWGSDVPYLRSVVSEYDSFDKYYGVNKTFSETDVRTIIESATGFTLSGNPGNWFTPLSADQGGLVDGGYVGAMLIDGNSYYTKNGNKVNITGRVIRENIFGYRLNSTKFTVSYSNGKFTFTTYGYGHGVGMSQHGANLYASNGGYNYMQILQHYYSGITVS